MNMILILDNNNLVLFIIILLSDVIMSLPLLSRLPWTSCLNPTLHQFDLRKENHDIDLIEEAVFCSRTVSPHLDRYRLNIYNIDQMLTDSSPVAYFIPNNHALSDVTPILLIYRVFDVTNKGEVNPQRYFRLPFKFDHKCVRHTNLL